MQGLGFRMKDWKRKRKLSIIGFRVWGGHEGMEKIMKTTIMGYLVTTIRIHSFIPS